MKYVVKQPYHNTAGFTLIELMLAVALLGLVALGIFSGVLFGQQSITNAGTRNRTTAVANATLDIVRGLRSQIFDTNTILADGTYGLERSTGRWLLDVSNYGTGDTNDSTGLYREIAIDRSTNPDQAKIKITVWSSGDSNSSTTQPLSVSTIVSNWESFVDQQQVSQDSALSFGEGTTTGFTYGIVQSFVPTVSSISGVRLYKKADTGSFTAGVQVSIYADAGGVPDIGSLVTQQSGTSLELTDWWASLDVGVFSVDLPDAGLTPGNTYWIAVEPTAVDISGSTHPNLGVYSSGGYGDVETYNADDGWSVPTGESFYFETLY